MTLQTEDREIDRALELCKLIQGDLLHCVNLVQRLDRKYNMYERNRIEITPMIFNKTFSLKNPKAMALSKARTLALSTITLASLESGKADGRTSHELEYIFVTLKNKCIKLRREMEAVVAHAQRVTENTTRQKNVQHRMLKDSQGSKTFICKHWGNTPRSSVNERLLKWSQNR